ncbi:hypothetical protein Hanom_Chr15g01364951 [Helianthus anomalus]
MILDLFQQTETNKSTYFIRQMNEDTHTYVVCCTVESSNKSSSTRQCKAFHHQD